uniref:NADH-ubiquinone oxidoreductase chain 2 n=1 Tax=[Candida] alai TaxID=434040 RepID=E3VW17_9ASCO|nr:NADH dehydrogenase subunit 2 [[Candida] alai]ADO51040.1 NADH dehydrogenase subunit 2 [[Candida] alai]
MILSSFLIYLVYTTFNLSNLKLINRLFIIIMSFTLILILSSYNILFIDNISLYNDWFKLTSLNIPVLYLIIIFIIILFIYNTSSIKYNIQSSYLILLILANIIGILLLPMSNDLISFYIVLELQSYSLYLLTGLHNKSYNSIRASLLYFIIGGIASVLILLSIFYIYNITGTTNLSIINIYNNYNNNDINLYSNILLIGLLFKMGMAPLHNWSISVYNYSPTYITAYISIIAKLSIVSFIFINNWLFNKEILIIFFYLSLFIAAYKPLYQINIKIILAYSGILNFSYILLTIVTYDISYYLYLIQYTLTHVLLFIIILLISEYNSKPYNKWSPIVFIHQLIIPNKILVLSFILCLFSLIGIPPLPGFYAKFYVIVSLINDNYILESITIVIFSVIATYYYAYIIKILIKNYNNYNNSYINLNPFISYIVSILTILILSFYSYLPMLSEGLLTILL